MSLYEFFAAAAPGLLIVLSSALTFIFTYGLYKARINKVNADSKLLEQQRINAEQERVEQVLDMWRGIAKDLTAEVKYCTGQLSKLTEENHQLTAEVHKLREENHQLTAEVHKLRSEINTNNNPHKKN